MTICPLCGLEAAGESVQEPDAKKFTCKRCGEYGVSREMVDSARLQRDPYLSAAARQAYEAGNPILIRGDNWSDLSEAHRRTSVSERVDKALRYLASKGRPGKEIWINMGLDYPVADAENQHEFHSYLVSCPINS